MKNSTHDPFEEAMRDKLNSFEVEYNPEDWKDMEERLDQRKNNRSLKGLWFVIALLGMGSSIAYLAYGPNMEDEQVVDEKVQSESVALLHEEAFKNVEKDAPVGYESEKVNNTVSGHELEEKTNKNTLNSDHIDSREENRSGLESEKEVRRQYEKNKTRQEVIVLNKEPGNNIPVRPANDKENTGLIYSKTFSPNGDGENDLWEITTSGSRIGFIRVKDNNGKELYFSTKNKPWDGTANGKEVPAGYYKYHIRYISPDGEEKDQRGLLELAR